MSQPPNNKGKDISGKKYASLNVNQTYKGTKVENRSAAGGSRSLGIYATLCSDIPYFESFTPYFRISPIIIIIRC